MMPGPGAVFALSALLFAIGLVGLVLRRNLVVQAMCVQIMLGAGQLAMAGFGRMHGVAGTDGGVPQGELLIVASLVISAAQLAVGLGLVFGLVRQRASVDADDAGLMRG